MTADCPEDFPYEPVHEASDAAVRRGYWAVAVGLQRVDDLEPSAYLRDLARQHVEGTRSLEDTGRLLRAYYRQRDAGRAEAAPSGAGEREADLVSQRIVELLSAGAFALMPAMLSAIHEALFRDLDADIYQPGRYKTVALQKKESVLNGDSVVYADPSLIERLLAFLFDEEDGYLYGIDFDEAQLQHFARFVARLWQVHPFMEGNTRTVAVFAVLYLRYLGFDAENEPFERHARYFRDALVRANYRNAKAGVMPEPSFLMRFFENLLTGAHHELRSRDLIVQALFDDPSLLRNVDPSQALAGIASAPVKEQSPSALFSDDALEHEAEACGVANLLGSADDRSNKQEHLEVITATDSVDILVLTTRPRNALRVASISTIMQLVDSLASLVKIPHLGGSSLSEVRESLKAKARSFSFAPSYEQAEALADISGSSQYVFDPFGILCLTDSSWFDHCSSSDETTPIEVIGLAEPIVRRLKSYGFHTVGDVTALSENQLLSLRGIGAGKVDAIKRALRAVPGKNAQELRSEMPRRKAFDHRAFLALFSSEAKALSLALQRTCREREYPVYEPSFEVCVLPYIQENHTAGVSEDSIVVAVVTAVESSDHLKSYCAKRLLAASDRIMQGSGGGRFVEQVSVPPGRAWEQSALELSQFEASLIYDRSDNALLVEYPSVLDWIETLPIGKREIVRMRFSGRTLESCGIDLGVTRERVRQIVKSVLKKRPILSEDRYRSLFDTYDLSEKDFCEITQQPPEIYHYLEEVSFVNKTDKLPLQNALEDDALSDGLREAIREMVFKAEFVCEDGVVVRADRRSIIEYLVKRHATDTELSLQELQYLFDMFVESHAIDVKEWHGEELRALKAYLERCDFVMKAGTPGGAAGRDAIRYYDAKAKDFSSLEELLSSGRYGAVECSTALLIADPEMCAVADELDIRNEYELHYAIGRFCSPLEGVKLGRTPTILFGDATRDSQILSLIKELGPADAHALADEYERRYGIKSATFRGSFLKGFDPFCKEGLYELGNESLQGEERSFLVATLESSDDCFPMRFLETRFEERFPGRSSVLLGEGTLEPFGYVLTGSLCMRSRVDRVAFFADLIASHEKFSVRDAEFGDEVFSNEAFRAELEKAKRAFEVIEVEKGLYERISRIKERGAGFSSDDLRSYLEEAIAFMQPAVPYTVKKLRSEGFSHPIDTLEEAGYGTYLFESILSMGYVGSRLRRTSVGNVTVVCRTRQTFSMITFVEYVVKTQRICDIAELADYIRADYGVEMGRTLLRSVVKRSHFGFDAESDRVLAEV